MYYVLAVGIVKAQVGGAGLASALLHAQETVYVPVLLKVSADKSCVIIGPVINNYYLIVAVCLLLEAHGQFVYVLALILAGDQDGYQRVLNVKHALGYGLRHMAAPVCELTVAYYYYVQQIVSWNLNDEHKPVDIEQVH